MLSWSANVDGLDFEAIHVCVFLKPSKFAIFQTPKVCITSLIHVNSLNQCLFEHGALPCMSIKFKAELNKFLSQMLIMFCAFAAVQVP